MTLAQDRARIRREIEAAKAAKQSTWALDRQLKDNTNRQLRQALRKKRAA